MENTETRPVNGDLEPHKMSTIVPGMSSDDYHRLTESMEAHGYLEDHPIMLFEGRILDGGHRYRAANEVGVTPTYRDFKGTEAQALAFILASNTHRRHLTKRQIAQTLVNAESLKPERKRATTKQLAAAAGVSEQTVREAEKLNEKDPPGAAAVAAGTKSADRADAKAGVKKSKGKAATQKAQGSRVVSVNMPIKLWNRMVDVGAAREQTAMQFMRDALEAAVKVVEAAA